MVAIAGEGAVFLEEGSTGEVEDSPACGDPIEGSQDPLVEDPAPIAAARDQEQGGAINPVGPALQDPLGRASLGELAPQGIA